MGDPLESWEAQLRTYDLPEWDNLPELELYMDQVTGYLNEVFAPLCPPGEEKILTKAMVNNYVKQKVMAPPTKKKYGRAHVAQLLAICALKQVLSIQEVAQLIRIQTQICEVQRAYDYFCGQLEEALKQTVQGKLENSGASEEQLLVIHATRAYASKVYLQKLLEFENTKAS